MFIFWGSRWREQPLGQLKYQCGKCARTVYHTASVRKTKFTFFFIPLFTFRTDYLIICNVCGLRSKAVHQLLEQLRQWHETGVLPAAIGAGS
jgi:zinc-ribbon family